MAPQKKVFRKSWDENALVVTLATSEKDAKQFPLSELSEGIRAKLALHGLTQKLSDATAKEAGTSIAEKWDAINDVWAALLSGEWTLKREGAGTLLLRALCELYPNKSRDALKTWLESRSTAERSELERHAPVRAIIDRIRSERATDIDVDALLDGLD